MEFDVQHKFYTVELPFEFISHNHQSKNVATQFFEPIRKIDPKSLRGIFPSITISYNRDIAYDGGYNISYCLVDWESGYSDVIFWKCFDCTEDVVLSELIKLRSMGYKIHEEEPEIF